MNITLEEAKTLSIEKWQEIVDNNGYELDNSEYDEFKYECAFCELCVKKNELNNEYCDNCPIDLPKSEYNYTLENLPLERRTVLFKGCCQDKHPWSIWNRNQTVKTAEVVLKMIENCKV